ncbi:HAD family hydrolase [Pseudohaliea sp.]|uniref:HAD family hydrolase n=1 Tax=Pseudohaliea sp. TaxID=2740289 RepID=UPI0032EB622B
MTAPSRAWRWPALLAALACLCAFSTPGRADEEPLPSWRETPTRAAILDFVARVSDPASDDFVPMEARIAVFDNDGNLWAEQPVYFQLLFAVDRLRALAEAEPALRQQAPFSSILAEGPAALAALDEAALVKLVLATHTGLDSTTFNGLVADWAASATHPRFGQRYTDLTYAPMRELLDYLGNNGFTCYIVSGGGVAFMRAWAPAAYGIPPERIIGSRFQLTYRADDSGGTLQRLPELSHINDGPGKPVGIQQVIGRRPIFASGNSDGDLEMLTWTTSGEGPRFGLLLHHTDGEREWAYDRESHVGKLDEGLERAPALGWTVVDMARDWARVFAFEAPVETATGAVP